MEGILFYIRNEHGKQLFEILEGIISSSWYWSVSPEEAYYTRDYNSRKPLPFFSETKTIMDGQTFIRHISEEDYILIFADIKAFPTLESVVEIDNETKFMKSSCKLGLIVSDSAQVIVYSREKQIILEILKRAESIGYKDIRFMNKEEIIAAVWGWMPRNWA
ncbi:DUF2691 family protein [Sporosarcina luteola]|uniref:DUF2691 family protein n=1 Tax=Sporosarcina luteola TaxID=582850 RepID=UPI00203DA395|nr:DUF2691 family protein [Sporosarcina luteola]